MYRTPLAALIAGLFFAPLAAQATEENLLDTIVVTATRIPTSDIAAPFASEVHTRNMIEKSGASTLYDYLAQHTSVQVMPAFGSRAMPLLDMRGYGLESGYQNIAITVDGQRLNNIDQVSQLIGAIPLADIERIEITKGSGSVMYGDGATAGSIQIQTRQHMGVNFSANAGNFGARDGVFNAGYKDERISVSGSANYDASDGTSAPDANGHRDESSNRVWRGALELHPNQRLKLSLDADSSRIDSRYVYALTLPEFQADPGQFSSAYTGNPYNRQLLANYHRRLGAELKLSPDWTLAVDHGREGKRSDYMASYGNSSSSYDYLTDDLALRYKGTAFDLAAGVQSFDGVRGGDLDRTNKRNTAWYAQGQYRLSTWTLSAGARTERVDYNYAPNSGAGLHANHVLNAWDLGLNRRIDAALSIFANLDRSFQAPDIDRFFNCTGWPCVAKVFNGFIQPELSLTANLGLNHITTTNRLKLTLFRADLHNEIYYFQQVYPLPSYNTNFDKTHKYGLEIQDAWRFDPDWSTTLNYTYTRAVIDRQTGTGGAYDDKELPGVPRHGVVLGLAYAPRKDLSLNLTHTWRDSAWAIGDFANHNAQRQAAYQSTDIACRQRVGRFEWTATVQNLFAHRNGLWTGDDAIYPVNFTRSYRVGVSARF